MQPVDVVVVGCGAAGASAAIDARAAGATVAVFDRGEVGSGTTGLAGGHIYLGGGTPVQVACGFSDTPDNMHAYLTALSREPDDHKIRRYCDGSVAHFTWLEANGVQFDRSHLPGKHLMQHGRECLVSTGNEAVWPFREIASPVPRGHKVAVVGDAGPTIAAALANAAIDAGAALYTGTHVTELLRNEGGVVGVVFASDGGLHELRARRGVVLAGGGFVMNKEMVNRYAPVLASTQPIGSPTDDGAAIRLGLEAGGSVTQMDGAFLSTTHYPPSSMLKGLIVNRLGERFVAEDSYHGRTGAFVAAQPGGAAHLILDEATFAHPKLGTLPFVDLWSNVREMALALGMPPGALAATIHRYNEGAAQGEDRDLHKAAEWVQPLIPPFAVFDMSIGVARYSGFTLGGLRTSPDGEVLDGTAVAVPGLFAAGACASNLVQDGASYNSGLSLGEATFFGRAAGRRAAARQPDVHAEAGSGGHR